MKHPGHMYGGFVPTISEWGMTHPQDPGGRDAGVCALEKLQALAAAREAVEEPGGQDLAPSSLRQCSSSSAPRVQPEDVTVKTDQVGTAAGQTTSISGDLDNK
jgi:hypothetical protein